MNQMTHASKDLKKSAATSRISYFFGAFGHDIFMRPCQHTSSLLLPHTYLILVMQHKIIAWFCISLRLSQVCVLLN